MKPLAYIKREIGKEFGRDVIALVLFGSRAKGKAKKTSDYDLLLLLKRKRKVEELEKRLMKELRKSVEIHALTADEFRENVIEGMPILLSIFRHGKVLIDNGFFRQMRELYIFLHERAGIEVVEGGRRIRVSDLK